MSTIIRGSGDTTFGGTIQSTGIDDNATSTAIIITDTGTEIDANLVVTGTSPQIQLETGASHYNWQVAAQESAAGSFEISSGNADADATNDTYTPRLLINSAGNVGIGTSSPDSNSQLHIKKTGANAKITLETDESNDCYINFSGATSEASFGYEPTSNAFVFSNAADGLTSNERMRIDSSGNVGIGTTAPAGPLDVVLGTSTPFYLRREDNGNQNIQCSIGSGGGSFTQGGAVAKTFTIGNATNGSLSILTNGAERMLITSDGRGLSQFTAKAWVNFKGDFTLSVRDSHNISSVTDLGTGYYSINLLNSLANTNYACIGSAGEDSGALRNFGISTQGTVSAQRINITYQNGTNYDVPYIYGTFFGD